MRAERRRRVPGGLRDFVYAFSTRAARNVVMAVALRNLFCVLCVSHIIAGCNEPAPARIAAKVQPEPTFYRSLADQRAIVDQDAARDMISLYRRNNGLSAVDIDPKLQQAAQAQADAMAKSNVLDHNVRGSLAARLADIDLRRASAVENVSAGYHTLAEAFSGWRQSTPHNRNMLERRAKHMGIATAYAPGTKYKVFWALILTD
jgi:uncharacterized protein YkwD